MVRSFVNLLTFRWLNSLFSKAEQSVLQFEDSPELPAEWHSGDNFRRLHRLWGKQILLEGTLVSGWRSDSLLGSLFRVFYIPYLFAGLLLLISSLLAFTGPVMLARIILCVEENAPFRQIVINVVLFVGFRLVLTFISTQYNFCVNNVSVAAGAALKGCVYYKILQLSSDSKRHYTTGVISNLYTVDVDRLVNLFKSFHNVWVLPIQIALCMTLLFQEVSFAMFGGLSIIVILLVINNYIANFQKKESDMIMFYKDERMKALSEMLGAVLTVKLNAWEPFFEKKILAQREKELFHLRRSLIISSVIICLFWLAPNLVSVATIFTYAKLMSQRITASRIFTAISLFRLLQGPLREFPMIVSQAYQAWTSVERLEAFYASEELQRPDNLTSTEDAISSPIDCNRDKDQSRNHETGTLLCKSRLQFCWDRLLFEKTRMESEEDVEGSTIGSDSSFAAAASALSRLSTQTRSNGIGFSPLQTEDADEREDQVTKEIELPSLAHHGNEIASREAVSMEGFAVHFSNDIRISPGQLIVVEGSVGSGKSSLCSSILKEMYHCDSSCCDDHHEIFGSVAFAAQQPWIQNATIRNNILFYREFDEAWYNSVVKACCLLTDFDELPMGDRTEIGEKGLNLSGGQKARVALARAAYGKTDIIILDDILAALDAIVAKRVFEDCVLGILAGKTRILVTHNPEVIAHPSVDAVWTVVQGLVIPKENEKRAITDSVAAEDREMRLPYGDTSVQSIKSKESATQSFICVEDRSEGAIEWRVYREYFRAMGGWKVFVFLSLVQISWQCLQVNADIFLAGWSKQSDEEQRQHLISNLITYSLLAVIAGSTVFVRSMTVTMSAFAAARWMFAALLEALLNAPMSWFDVNPTGRILNRLSDDMACVDMKLGFAVGSIFAMGFAFLGNLVTILIIFRYLIVPLIPILWIYRLVLVKYMKTSRELQRLLRISQSPILSFMAETNNGVHTIRAFGATKQSQFEGRHFDLIDANTRMQYVVNASGGWYVLRVQLLGTSIILFLCLFILLGRGYLSPGLVGLSLSYGLDLLIGLESIVFHVADLENQMVCPERLLQYIGIPPEGTDERKALYRTSKNAASDNVEEQVSQQLCLSSLCFPKAGKIEFRHVSFKYQPQGELILRDLSFVIPAQYKVGIVGRTGSGKSTISMCLFRIAELAAGTVLIDDVDISLLSLSTLRSAIEIIPQMPVLFRGSLRCYMDPFDEYTNDEIWTAFEKTQLTGIVRSLAKRSASPNPKRTSSHSPTCSPTNSRSPSPFLQFSQKGVEVYTPIKKTDADSTPAKNGSGVQVEIETASVMQEPDDALEAEVAENGENLSVGERQLLVLSRALLRKSKIVVMDEATASVDAATDRKIQGVLSAEFRHSTVITIAHRIDTIANSDLILVMDAGQLVEMGSPQELFVRPDGIFAALAKEHNIRY